MADISLGEAASDYLASIKGPSRGSVLAELERFTRWYGPDRPISGLRGHDINTYAETMGPANPDTMKRAEHVRAFLVHLKKTGLMDTNLATHLRLKKSGKSAAGVQHAAQPSSVELTAEGVDALKKERESLQEQRIAVREEIRKAMLDKDFRENAPLDAAKDKQGHIEARFREIEAMLKRAVVVDGRPETGRVHVGSSVRVKDVASGRVMQYSIVGPTEANAAEGKISSVSPVGKALLDRGPGDQVEVTVPAGSKTLVIEDVEG